MCTKWFISSLRICSFRQYWAFLSYISVKYEEKNIYAFNILNEFINVK